MTTGALIFALNTGSVDYVKLAVHCARQVKKHLNIPVSIATDSKAYLIDKWDDALELFDEILEITSDTTQQKRFYDGTLASSVSTWKNTSRNQAYYLTPYETTLVLDSDYIINSSVLLAAFDRDCDFQIYKGGVDLAEWRSQDEFIFLNRYSIDFYWATVFVFKKTAAVEALFNLVSYVKQEWDYFRFLYRIKESVFRNDYAFSIAIHIMNGQTSGEFATLLPGNMVYGIDRDLLVEVEDTAMQFLVEKQDYSGEYTFVKTQGLDVHVMNKKSLLRAIEEVEDV
jgi:hypothetical protein